MRCSRRNRFLGALLGVILCVVMPGTAWADMQGIDVSSNQSPGITRVVSGDFAMVKVTQGPNYTNPYWIEQAIGTTDTGKALGLYDYASGGDPVVEASVFVSKSAAYVGTAVLALDWEEYQNSAFGDTNWIVQFVNRVHALTGVWPMVYTSGAWVGQTSGVRQVSGLWVAQYASNAATGYQSAPWNLGAYGEAMRQYSSNGWINGYGPLDLDLFRGDRAAWMKYANPSSKPIAPPVPEPSPAPAPKPSTSCVVVGGGDTLSGIASRTGLQPWSAWSGYRSGNPNVLYVGDRVCYGGASAPATVPSGTYVVRSGDYLSKVWPTSWLTIARLNNLYPPYTVYPGEVLRTTGGNAGRYTVQSGDTLGSIAARYGISVSSIHGYRSGNPNVIYVGESLYW